MKQQKLCGSSLHIEEGNGDETTRFTQIKAWLKVEPRVGLISVKPTVEGFTKCKDLHCFFFPFFFFFFPPLFLLGVMEK
jgi:hypothetical protein